MCISNYYYYYLILWLLGSLKANSAFLLTMTHRTYLCTPNLLSIKLMFLLKIYQFLWESQVFGSYSPPPHIFFLQPLLFSYPSNFVPFFKLTYFLLFNGNMVFLYVDNSVLNKSMYKMGGLSFIYMLLFLSKFLSLRPGPCRCFH